MAKIVNLGGDGSICVGDDIDVVLEVLAPGTETPVDMTAWTTSLVISKSATSAALATVAGVVAGTYDADRGANGQRVTFALTDTVTATLTAGDYVYSAKRTDAGSERVLAYGKFLIDRANQI